MMLMVHGTTNKLFMFTFSNCFLLKFRSEPGTPERLSVNSTSLRQIVTQRYEQTLGIRLWMAKNARSTTCRNHPNVYLCCF